MKVTIRVWKKGYCTGYCKDMIFRVLKEIRSGYRKVTRRLRHERHEGIFKGTSRVLYGCYR